MKKPWNSHPSHFRKLWSYSTGFYAVWIAHVGRRFGLFDEIAKKSITANQLAEKTGLYQPAVIAWCSAAMSYDFICQSNGRLYISIKMKEMLLDKKDPNYLGGQFSYIALRSLEYGALDDLFRRGKTCDMTSTMDAIEQATDWDHYALLASIKRNKSLDALLSRGCSVLDVGCGSGTLLVKMHDQYPSSAFTGIDPSKHAVTKARKMLKNRIKILMQAGEDISFAAKFDLVHFGESLYATMNKEKVLTNCYKALKKGGTVAIIESLIPEDGTEASKSQENKLIMGMQLDFALQGHTFMNRTEVEALLKRAGFSNIGFTDLGGSIFLVTAKKK